jgi:hypothetical protein
MDWSYFAGFLDGEGSILLIPPRVRLYISNTNKDVLEKIKRFVGCGRVYHIKRNNEKWLPQYGWAIGNHKDVLRILENIENKLIVKRELCIKAIFYIKNKRWQRDYISKEELKKLVYLKSSRKIAKKLGVSQFSVLKYLKKYDLFKK